MRVVNRFAKRDPMPNPAVSPAAMADRRRWAKLRTKMDERFGKGAWHCDHILEAGTAPACVLRYLRFARASGNGNAKRYWSPKPELFATYKGRRVQVVMAFPGGSVGITDQLADPRAAFQGRVYLPELTDFSGHPTRAHVGAST